MQSKIEEFMIDAKPALKWAGGKRSLLPEIRKFIPPSFNSYFEPFFGGGAVYLDIVGRVKSPRECIINDVNTDLINFYRDVKDSLPELINEVKSLAEIALADNDGYYNIRSHFNGVDRNKNQVLKYEGVERSAALLVLNRTCFNGLYRVNSKGLFNVPKGSYKKPQILNESNLQSLSKLLPPIENMYNSQFNEVPGITKGDFVYFDPPYQPLSQSSSFTSYSGVFGEGEQVRLKDYFKELDDKGVYVLASNSSAEFISELYSEFTIVEIQAARNVNSVSSKRGKVIEYLIVGESLRKALTP